MKYPLKYGLSVTVNNVTVSLLLCKPPLLTNSRIAILWLSCYGRFIRRDPYYFAVQFILVRLSCGNSHSCLCDTDKEHKRTNKRPDTHTFQRDTQCSSTDCLLMLRCQLYTFRTVTVHPQELLFRCCMCRLWYVVRNALSDRSRWYNTVPAGRTR